VTLTESSFTGCRLFQKIQPKECFSIHNAGVIPLVIEFSVVFTSRVSNSCSSSIYSARLLLSSFVHAVSLLAIHYIWQVNMKEDFSSGSSYRVSTRITARPLKARRPWPNPLEIGYGRVGWRSLLVLVVACLVLSTVIAVPVLVSKSRSVPVSCQWTSQGDHEKLAVCLRITASRCQNRPPLWQAAPLRSPHFRLLQAVARYLPSYLRTVRRALLLPFGPVRKTLAFPHLLSPSRQGRQQRAQRLLPPIRPRRPGLLEQILHKPPP
jgi:hypothetical protein